MHLLSDDNPYFEYCTVAIFNFSELIYSKQCNLLFNNSIMRKIILLFVWLASSLFVVTNAQPAFNPTEDILDEVTLDANNEIEMKEEKSAFDWNNLMVSLFGTSELEQWLQNMVWWFCITNHNGVTKINTKNCQTKYWKGKYWYVTLQKKITVQEIEEDRSIKPHGSWWLTIISMVLGVMIFGYCFFQLKADRIVWETNIWNWLMENINYLKMWVKKKVKDKKGNEQDAFDFLQASESETHIASWGWIALIVLTVLIWLTIWSLLGNSVLLRLGKSSAIISSWVVHIVLYTLLVAGLVGIIERGVLSYITNVSSTIWDSTIKILLKSLVIVVIMNIGIYILGQILIGFASLVLL